MTQGKPKEIKHKENRRKTDAKEHEKENKDK